MRVFKILGAGPKTGFVAYGFIKKFNLKKNQVILESDELDGFGLPAEIKFSTITGAAIFIDHSMNETETDLYHLDSFDLPRLQESPYDDY